MKEPKYKMVRAKRQGFYDGHRRRAGSEFPVAVDAREPWFEDVGPAPEGVVPPSQLLNVAAPNAKSFAQVMRELGEGEAPKPDLTPKTLAQAQAEAPPPQDDLVG